MAEIDMSGADAAIQLGVPPVVGIAPPLAERTFRRGGLDVLEQVYWLADGSLQVVWARPPLTALMTPDGRPSPVVSQTCPDGPPAALEAARAEVAAAFDVYWGLAAGPRDVLTANDFTWGPPR